MAVVGLNKLQADLEKRIPARIREANIRALEKGANELVAMIKRLVPKDELKLMNSVGWTWGDAPEGSITIASVGGRQFGTLRITVFMGDATTIVYNSRGIAFQNALLQEFGTKNMPANPSFYPSYRALRKRIRSRVRRESRKAIRFS